MKKLFVLISLIFTTYFSQAQHFYFGVQGGYMFNQNQLKTETLSMYLEEDYSLANSSTQYKNNFTKGFHLGFQFAKHWAVEAQLNFSKEGFSEKRQMLWCVIDDSACLASTRVTDMKILHDYQYMRIPLLVRYYLKPITSKFNISASAGLNFGVLLHQQNTSMYTNLDGQELQNTYSDKGPRDLNMGYQLGLKTEYTLKNHFNLFAETFWYHIDNSDASLINNYYENTRLINQHVALNFGISYKF